MGGADAYGAEVDVVEVGAQVLACSLLGEIPHEFQPAVSVVTPSVMHPHPWCCRWGMTLAAGLVGRGRGSRSFLHHARQGIVMHDASYWACLCIQGPLEALSSGLRLIR